MKRILITGVNGFTSRHFVIFLSMLKIDNREIFGIDKNSYSSSPRNYNFIKADLLVKKQILAILKSINPDYIFHFAGLNFGDNYKNLFNHNVIATMNLLNAAANIKSMPRILIIGSAAEYGIVPQGKQPISESALLRQNPLLFMG